MTDTDDSLASLLCANPRCKEGDAGYPRVFVPGRHWSKYCCVKCRMAVASVRRAARNAKEGA